MKVPYSPFTTHLSGSAKETELRLRNIFQWKKKRPPVIALIAAVLVVVFCGSLIGFSNTPRNGTLGEIYQAYFAENPTNMIDYENKEAAYPSLALESENFGTALEYVRSMELRSVLGQKKYIGDFNNRNGAVVLRSAAGQELWIDLYRTGYVVVSNEGAGRLDKGDDAKVYKVSESFDVEVFLNYLATEQSEKKVPDELKSAPVAEVPLHAAKLTGLTLDEHGQGDDSLTVLTYEPSWEEPGGHPEAIVRLGTGEELTCTLFCNSKSRPVLEAAYLTSETRQSVLICLESTISNYGYARYHVLEVVDGELVVTDLTGERETLYEYSVCPRSVSELASVSISVLGNSKGNPDWITLTWADGNWKEETGLYYSDTHTLTVADGRELTLLIEGVLLEDRKNYYRLSKLELYDGYDRLQTIDANSIEFDGDYLFQGLYVAEGSGPYGEPIVWDINFDGSQDISFLCCYVFPINIPYAHFLWNEETQQLTFNTVLCAYLELDEENHRLVEQMVGAAGANDWYNTYEFNADRQLVLIDSKIIRRT